MEVGWVCPDGFAFCGLDHGAGVEEEEVDSIWVGGGDGGVEGLPVGGVGDVDVVGGRCGLEGDDGGGQS